MVIYLFFYIILYPFVGGWYNVFLFQFWEISVPFHCEVRSGISCIWQHSLFVLPLRTKHRSWIRGSWGSFYFSDPRVTTGLCHDGHAREQSVRLLHNGISVGSRPGLSPVWMGILKSFNSSVTLGSLAPEEIHPSSSNITVYKSINYPDLRNRWSYWVCEWWRHDLISTHDTHLSPGWVITREFTRMGNIEHQQTGIKFLVWSNWLRMKHCQYLVMTLSFSHMLRQAQTCRSFTSNPSKSPIRTDAIQKTVTDSEGERVIQRWGIGRFICQPGKCKYFSL